MHNIFAPHFRQVVAEMKRWTTVQWNLSAYFHSSVFRSSTYFMRTLIIFDDFLLQTQLFVLRILKWTISIVYTILLNTIVCDKYANETAIHFINAFDNHLDCILNGRFSRSPVPTCRFVRWSQLTGVAQLEDDTFIATIKNVALFKCPGNNLTWPFRYTPITYQLLSFRFISQVYTRCATLKSHSYSKLHLIRE